MSTCRHPNLTIVTRVQSSDPWFYLYVYLFVAAYIQYMTDFIYHKGTLRCWWSDQRMWLMRSLTSFTFGSIQFVCKQLNISTQGFNVTSKVMEDEQIKRYYGRSFQYYFKFALSIFDLLRPKWGDSNSITGI
jgi:hypothetical protein